jgi:hypothetical protein
VRIKEFFTNKDRLFNLLVFVLVLGLLCLGEYFLSNSLRVETVSYHEQVLDLNQADLRGKTTRSPEGILMQAGSSIVFHDVGEEIINVSLTLERADLKIVNVTVSASDDADKNAFRTYVDGDVYTDEPAYFRIRSFGNVRDLQIRINEGETALLTSVVLNRVPAVRFSFLRVALLFFLILGLWLVWHFRLWKIIYDNRNPLHLAVLSSLLVLFVLAFTLCGAAAGGGQKYPFENTEHLNAYEQLFDALMQGKTEIDVDFDTEILDAMEDPYDYTERKEVYQDHGHSVFNGTWDRAYYNGNFYCYFGIAPVLLFMLPVYFFTGMVPNAGLTTVFVCIIGICSLFGLLLKMIRYFKVKVPLLLLCIGYPVLVLGSLLPMIALCADMYYLAVASGISFFCLTAFLGFSALCSSHALWRRVLFALSGISLAVTLASRPTVVLYAAVLIPPFLAVLFEKGRATAAKLIDAAAFLLPLIVAVIPVLWYNYIRFDSPFEFGATYQLTFSNISYNQITPALLGETFFHYFLQYPQISGLFPYLRPSHLALDTYGTYFYSVSSIGALAFPLTWCGAAQGFTTKKQPVKKATYLLLLLLPFAVAFANLCLGGVNIRYLSDILFPLILLGLLVVLELAGKASERLSDGTSYRIFLLFAGILALTALMAFFLLFANERNGIYLQNPAVFRFFASLFS